MSERWRAGKDQQERCISLEMSLADEVERVLFDPDQAFPHPSRDWEVEGVPDDEDAEYYPLIYVHKPTGQRFEIEWEATARSLPDPETERRQQERDAELLAGQMEIQ